MCTQLFANSVLPWVVGRVGRTAPTELQPGLGKVANHNCCGRVPTEHRTNGCRGTQIPGTALRVKAWRPTRALNDLLADQGNERRTGPRGNTATTMAFWLGKLCSRYFLVALNAQGYTAVWSTERMPASISSHSLMVVPVVDK